MQRLTYVVFINLAQERPCQPERDYMCACVQIGKWRPSQRIATTECGEWLLLSDQGEFEAMKTLNSRRSPRCDKHQFCAKMTVSI